MKNLQYEVLGRFNAVFVPQWKVHLCQDVFCVFMYVICISNIIFKWILV